MRDFSDLSHYGVTKIVLSFDSYLLGATSPICLGGGVKKVSKPDPGGKINSAGTEIKANFDPHKEATVHVE